MTKPTGSKRKARKSPKRTPARASRRKPTRRPKPCAHTHANYDTLWRGERVSILGCYAIVRDDSWFGYGESRRIFSARCYVCGAWLPLGPASDDTETVRVEMRAAELEPIWSLKLTSITIRRSRDEVDGANYHWRTNGGDYLPSVAAGWLARELATHDDREQRDRDAWPWPVDQPIEGPYEDADPDLQAGGPALNLKEILADIDPPLTVTIDSDSTPAAQINGLCDAPPLLTADEAEELADDLLLVADAVRQAAKDGYHGPALVVELLIGEEPVTVTIGLGSDDLSTPIPLDDIPIRYGAPEAIGLTPRQLREQTAAAVAAEDALRDPEVMARNAAALADDAAILAALPVEQRQELDAMVRGDRVDGVAVDLIPPTSTNCKLLGADRCEHDKMTAEETQAVFGEDWEP